MLWESAWPWGKVGNDGCNTRKTTKKDKAEICPIIFSSSILLIQTAGTQGITSAKWKKKKNAQENYIVDVFTCWSMTGRLLTKIQILMQS